MSRTAPFAPLLAAVVALAPTASTALIQQDQSGQWVKSSSDQAWKNAAGPCWRAGYWTPAHAIMECVGKAGPAERKREGKAEKQPVSENRGRTARN